MIHYHGSPCSGPNDIAARFWQGRHAMVSFAHPDQLPGIAEVCQSFALDNGAFSAWRGGQEFDYNGFAEFVQEWRLHPGFDWCLIPDVIDGSERDNDDLLKRWSTGLPGAITASVPVWHLHETVERLTRLAAQFRRVALGSSGQWSTPGTEEWWDRMREVMPYLCDGDGRPHWKIHGLRMLNPDIFTRLPFASADSTNAGQNGDRTGKRNRVSAWVGATINAETIEANNSPPVYCSTRTHRQAVLFA